MRQLVEVCLSRHMFVLLDNRFNLVFECGCSIFPTGVVAHILVASVRHNSASSVGFRSNHGSDAFPYIWVRSQLGVPGPIERFQCIVCADSIRKTFFILVPHLQGEERSSPSPRLGLVFGTNPCVDEVGTKIVQLSGMGSPILFFSGISLSQGPMKSSYTRMTSSTGTKASAYRV